MKKRIVALLLACLMVALPIVSLAADLTEVTIMAPSERRPDHPLSRIDEYTAYQEYKKMLEEKGVKLVFDLVSRTDCFSFCNTETELQILQSRALTCEAVYVLAPTVSTVEIS